MALFSLDELNSDERNNEKFNLKNITGSKKTKIKSRYIQLFGKRLSRVEDVIGNFSMGDHIHYVSAGEWSMHELLAHILNLTGPAKVWVLTWSVSENAVKFLLDMLEKKLILDLRAVFDWRVKVRTPTIFAMVKYNIDGIKLNTCHAKMAVIKNDKWAISIVGSANFTNNPRIEAGTISADKDISDFHIKWIDNLIYNSDPF